MWEPLAAGVGRARGKQHLMTNSQSPAGHSVAFISPVRKVRVLGHMSAWAQAVWKQEAVPGVVGGTQQVSGPRRAQPDTCSLGCGQERKPPGTDHIHQCSLHLGSGDISEVVPFPGSCHSLFLEPSPALPCPAGAMLSLGVAFPTALRLDIPPYASA